VTTSETLGMFKLFAELIGVHLDAIDRLRSSEASLADERKTAELREQFIAVLGHDLRNPLSAIVGSADLLLQSPLSELGSQLVGRIKRSSRRMSALIDDVLDFARGRLGGGLTLRVDDDEPLETVLQQVIAELRVSSGRTIETDIALGVPVRCDRSRLGQLFSNLLANAVSHGAADEPIRVRASSEGGVFRFSVSNGGEPIAASTLEQLFHPFFRGSVRPSEQGLGLGLYIASEIARAHGGTLDVSSTSEGTTFTFQMPLG
jgi:signal transduction histidine kinase